MKNAWYSKKSITIILHVIVWVLLFSLPALLRPSFNPNDVKSPQSLNTNILFIVSRISDVLLIIFFYLNAILFIPRLLYKKKYAFYSLSIFFSFASFELIMWVLRINFAQPEKHFAFSKIIFVSTFAFIFILACSIAFKTIRDKMVAEQLSNEKQNEHLKTELSLLRSQVSPHFIFNVLNNMVALARKRSDLLEPSLIRLSSLMRYMLYETDEDKVSLEKETEYLQSYIALQQQRFGKKVVINVTMYKADKMYDIEPMLLIPFVENAFKHGTGLIDEAHIDIDMKAEKNILSFRVSNKYNPASIEIKDKASGIGLINVQRRLELLYPDKHKLDITKGNSLFTGSLKINLAS